MTRFQELRQWLNRFPDDSELFMVETSIHENDAVIYVKTPDGEMHSTAILDKVYG